MKPNLILKTKFSKKYLYGDFVPADNSIDVYKDDFTNSNELPFAVIQNESVMYYRTNNKIPDYRSTWELTKRIGTYQQGKIWKGFKTIHD